MDNLTEVYYFPIDNEGNETGTPVRIGLNDDGSADLSALPEGLGKTLEAGVGDPVLGRVMPKDGARFLEELLRSANPYMRFRSKA